MNRNKTADQLIIPKRVAPEGKRYPGLMEASTRVSGSTPAALNVRLHLENDQELYAEVDEFDRQRLPEGMPIVQIQLGLN